MTSLNFYKAFLPELRKELLTWTKQIAVPGITGYNFYDICLWKPCPEDDFDAIVEVKVVISYYPTSTRTMQSGNYAFCYAVRGLEIAVMYDDDEYSGTARRIHKRWHQCVSNWLQLIRRREQEGATEKSRLIHEELVAVVWAPARVAALLERGGWDLVDTC